MEQCIRTGTKWTKQAQPEPPNGGNRKIGATMRRDDLLLILNRIETIVSEIESRKLYDELPFLRPLEEVRLYLSHYEELGQPLRLAN